LWVQDSVLAMSHLSESEVIRIWQARLQQERRLTDAAGGRVEVVYPGRSNDGRGGDFRDALIKTGDHPQSGCIEVHTRASGWREHGHHLDPAYNGVVLHVAWEPAADSAPTVLQNGRTVPTVILEDAGKTAAGAAAVLPCAGAAVRLPRPVLLESLARAGEARLILKAARYAAELADTAGGQVLYRGIAEALGYSRNKLPMVALATAAPLIEIAALNRSVTDQCSWPVLLTACLLGRAGLLPSQRTAQPGSPAPFVIQVEQAWQRLGLTAAMSRRDWELFKVRPANYPVRRIVALAGLLVRYPLTLWPAVFLDSLRTAAVQRTPANLCRFWGITAPGYWADHFDFDCRDVTLGPVLLGRERSGAILVNVLFPFALAWGRRTRDRALERLARDLSARYPRLAGNAIERHMLDQIGLDYHALGTARHQQGLLHIFQTRCTQGKCARCALSKKQIST
jgi:hypothetical protein